MVSGSWTAVRNTIPERYKYRGRMNFATLAKIEDGSQELL